MPLRARLDGTDVVAPLIGAADWEILRRSARSGGCRLVLPCCGDRAYQRTSPLGLRHFYHPPRSTCRLSGETQAHLLAKLRILQACERSGYVAQTEWAEGFWRADVLATRGAARVALEVQLSPLSMEGLLERQRRYRESGVRACWFLLHPPAELRRSLVTGDLMARDELPAFELVPADNHAYSVSLNGFFHHLDDFVQALLAGEIVFQPAATISRQSSLAVAFFRCRCWNCAGDVSVYRVGSMRLEATTRCGAQLRWKREADRTTAARCPPEFHPRVRALVRRYLATDAGNGLEVHIAAPRPRASTRGTSSPCFACPTCGAHFRKLQVRHRPETIVNLPLESESDATLDWPHWCYPSAGTHCDSSSP